MGPLNLFPAKERIVNLAREPKLARIDPVNELRCKMSTESFEQFAMADGTLP